MMIKIHRECKDVKTNNTAPKNCYSAMYSITHQCAANYLHARVLCWFTVEIYKI